MGHSTYSISDRALRSTTVGYDSKPRDQIFTQQIERRAHSEMMPMEIAFREARDSEAHPNTIPVQLYLDITGSMGHIPHELIKTGLPTLIGKLIQSGLPDIALMFGAIGDHECDRYPLQIAQFESGDAELDMWLTRTYLEGGGGGNAGESYGLAWYFAANHVKTDAWEKRQKKGFVITIGDEPPLLNYPDSAIRTIMGSTAQLNQGSYPLSKLYEMASERNHVYHINISHGGRGFSSAWKQYMGDNAISISDYMSLPTVISEIILRHSVVDAIPTEPSEIPIKIEKPKKEEIIL
jgi:hypothetical protein